MKEERYNILVIEDNPQDIKIMKRQLDKYHFDIDFATSGQEGLEKLKGKGYDIVVSDYSMPGMTGLDVLDGMKKEGYDIPLVIVTGAGSEKIAVKAMKRGAYDYLVKSLDPSWLEVFPLVIQNSFQRHWMTKEKEKAEEERRKLEDQLQQLQRLEAIGTLAGGIAHDFNNLLMAIQGHVSLMMLETGSDHPYSKRLKAIEDMIQWGADLTKQLLGFARGGKYEVKPTDLNELIRESSEIFGRTKKEIRLHRKYQDGIWPVKVDRGQIEQVLLNFYVNAWQAMPDGGDLYIETSYVVLDELFTKPFEVKPGNYVKISVTDTGVGMDKKIIEHIFDPFFTTKEMGHGAGLGLACAYGIIKNHSGIINVSSKKGEGSTFDIFLPASEREVTIKEKKLANEIVRGKENVLLVDDEEMILDVGGEMLKKMGYKVLLARGGKEAVELYRKHKEEIDLVILDMIMPDMGGGEAYDRMKENNPKVKALLSSGYGIDGQATEILERGCDGFIQKPFNMKELSGKIRDVL